MLRRYLVAELGDAEQRLVEQHLERCEACGGRLDVIENPWPRGYKKLERLGKGGQGEVYKARQEASGAIVAVKLLNDDGDRSDLCGKLNHPYIVPVFQMDLLWVVMEFIEGVTLRDRLKRRGPLRPADAVQLLLPVVDAVAYAHEMGLVAHYDLKPANILLDASRGHRPLVADFGLAVPKRGVQGRPRGTQGYMAPEQWDGKARSACDIFAIGVILWEMLTGLPLFYFKGATKDEIRCRTERLISEPPSKLNRSGEVDETLDAICLRCLEKKPDRRFRSARALRDEMEEWLESHGGWSARWPVPLAPIVGRSVKRQRYRNLAAGSGSNFGGHVCEVVGRNGAGPGLVFATGSVLVHYINNGNSYVEKRRVGLGRQETVLGLAAVSSTERSVVAIVGRRRTPEAARLRIIDLSEKETRPKYVRAGIAHLETIATLDGCGPLLLALASERAGTSLRGSGEHPVKVRRGVLSVCDLGGNQLCRKSLPFIWPSLTGEPPAVVPFAHRAWAVVGSRGLGEPKELLLFRIAQGPPLRVRKIGSPNLGRVYGICPLPNGRLAVTHRPPESNDACLSILNSDGKVCIQISMFTPHARRRTRGKLVGGFLHWHAPVGPLGENEVLLAPVARDGRIYTLRLHPDAKPEPLPLELSLELENECPTRVGISGGRTLFLFAMGAVVLGPSIDDLEQLGLGAWQETTKIVGVRADGEVLVRDERLVDGERLEASVRTAVPQFARSRRRERRRRSVKVRLTSEGWELSWAWDGAVLSGRRGRNRRGKFQWRAAEFFVGVPRREHDREEGARLDGRSPTAPQQPGSTNVVEIQDATGDGGDGIIVAVSDSTHIAIVRHSPGDPAVSEVLWQYGRAGIEFRIKFGAESRGLLLFELFSSTDDGHESVETRALDLANGDCRRYGLSASSEIVPLADGASLVLADEFFATEARLHVAGSAKLARLPGVFLPGKTFVYEQTERARKWRKAVSIVNRGWDWSVESSELLFDPDHNTVSQKTLEKPISLSRPETAQFTIRAATRFDDRLVIADSTGRIEIRSLKNAKRVLAIANVSSPPDSIAISRRRNGTFLVVSAGDLFWFNVSRFTDAHAGPLRQRR